MLKIFGLAVAVLLVVGAADASRASPADFSAGFARHATMGRPRPVLRLDRRFARRDREFRRRDAFFLGWPYGWWPPYEDSSDVYPSETPANYPPPPPASSQPPVPAPCPVLLHWDPKLSRATRESLCD